MQAKVRPEIHFKIVKECTYKVRFTKCRAELLKEEISNGSALSIGE